MSNRFGKKVWVTNQARESMQRRNIGVTPLEQVIEEREIKRRDEVYFWVYTHIREQADNLNCAAVIKFAAVVIKTGMVNWELEFKA